MEHWLAGSVWCWRPGPLLQQDTGGSTVQRHMHIVLISYEYGLSQAYAIHVLCHCHQLQVTAVATNSGDYTTTVFIEMFGVFRCCAAQGDPA